MQKYYDNPNNRLVFIENSASANYWDNLWQNNKIDKKTIDKTIEFDEVVKISKKYLKKGSLILEGGCGSGIQVYKLHKTGFNVIGIDFAEKTIADLNKNHPELNIQLGDVRKTTFPDHYFDAYWSFGVIEHFYTGYDDILNEMKRIIKPGGYLFISFPHLSPLRKLKIKNNSYAIWKENPQQINHFYQFALDKSTVMEKLSKIGFKLLEINYMAGIKGLKDEVTFLNKMLQKIYDSQHILARFTSKIISIIFNRFSSHSVRLILKKE